MKKRSKTRLSDRAFRHQWVSEAAYFNAERRHFVPGMALDDWLSAENEFVKMQIMRYQVIIQEDGAVTIKGLQRLAKSLGVESSEKITSEVELIRAIQQASRHIPCFNFEPKTYCHVSRFCLWREWCKKNQMIARW